MLQTISRFAGFGSFPVVFLLLGTAGLLLVRLFPALGEALTGIAEAITELFRSIRLGCGPLGLLLLPLESLWNLLKKLLALLWALLQQLLDWILAFLQWLFALFDGGDEVGCGCGCAPVGCLMIPFALLASLFGLGGDDDDSGGGGGGTGGGSSRSRSSDGSRARSPTHADASPERTRTSAGERERSRGAGVGAALGAVGAAGSKVARGAPGAVSDVTTGAVRGSGHPAASTSRGRRKRKRPTTRMVGKRASIPEQTGQSRVRRAVSSAVSGAKDAVAGAARETKENVKAAVGASTDEDYFGNLPERRALASAWSITDPADARDIAEILAERDIPHSWQIDEATGLPTVTIPNYAADQATGALGEHGFDVGEGMPADFVSVDRIDDVPEAGTVYDPETGEWVTPEPEWDEDDAMPALEERAVYDPDAGTLYDPATGAHFDEETQGWYGADGEPVAPDAEYAKVEEDSEGTHPDGQPALPAPSDEPDFVWGLHPEPVPVGAHDEDADEIVDAPHVEDVPPQGGEQ